MLVVEANGLLVGSPTFLHRLVTGNLGLYDSWVLFVYRPIRLRALSVDSSNNLIHPCTEVGDLSVCR